MKIILLFYVLGLCTLTTFLRPQKSREESIKAGREIYHDFCVQCHLANGEGVSGVFPPLKASDYLIEDIDRSIAGIKYGLKGTIVVNEEIYEGVMANQGLDNEEIADVMNYILNEWGNHFDGQITSQRVADTSDLNLNK